ncbi:MAG: Pseudouridine synthase [Candidatus Woesebacteria bacterium GW2011_GWC2_47_16]|uniref:Pseudouridine synthase n=8 Tax=Candidatus Woeseibacteriota TaxID=1752722 RepID=A0A0G1TVG6_9BACT|nr:MAG: Pseudouridine synthase [Candidatus Woesebacteria bacterium GW2011_GWF1_46_13]KKU49385.1 MAG: Pseudouridine synthase [Candidatus Woesebacteria bacterium GW2011_GWF2_46_8]KKU65197.1 MAG: Pseudouridine synthase [Candidatus Woesebacteria bacterium GW2011_GWC2_47_16]KKU71018.1 MAG: Pseudouridine synthase [Candidatus Woesebacteria bacterium GW2011_GWD1_47_21]OGM78666.1 MAG: hypothetical protein A2197_02080 [Candidatus Woesebacteria bacterium RIFOXYA1_FULL_48_16]OGM83963.1 MAG: hypothetical p
MEPKVIFEDAQLFVLDKPSGWIVNSAQTTKGQKVIQEWLGNLNFPLAKDNERRSGIVHRLDKETSGILLVAKTPETFENLQAQFKERQVAKAYTALVHGKIEPKNGKIEAAVGRLPWRRDRFGVMPGGREALTLYRVVDYFTKAGEKYSLVEAKPKTGRTHQIRIHLKYLGYPVVADEFYAGRKTARKDRIWCPRLFLHAASIEFLHPTRGQRVKFSSGLPDDLNSVLATLEKLRETT